MEKRTGRLTTRGRVVGRSAGWVAVISAISFGAGVAIANADSRVEAGRALYQQYCGSCHGLAADGNGEIASTLTPRPSDLRQIAASRDGVFPDAELQRVIDGRDPVVGHGKREMPVWGRRFGEAREPGVEKESAIRGDTQLLVAYLKSIQLAK